MRFLGGFLRSEAVYQILVKITFIVHSAFRCEDPLPLPDPIHPAALINIPIRPDVLPLQKNQKKPQIDKNRILRAIPSNPKPAPLQNPLKHPQNLSKTHKSTHLAMHLPHLKIPSKATLIGEDHLPLPVASPLQKQPLILRPVTVDLQPLPVRAVILPHSLVNTAAQRPKLALPVGLVVLDLAVVRPNLRDDDFGQSLLYALGLAEGVVFEAEDLSVLGHHLVGVSRLLCAVVLCLGGREFLVLVAVCRGCFFACSEF